MPGRSSLGRRLEGHSFPCSVGGDDEASDVFGDLGDDGVSEAPKSVHSIGKPCTHSAKEGLRPTTSSERLGSESAQILLATPSPRSTAARRSTLETSFHSRARRVGNNEHPLSPGWGTEGGSGVTIPFRIVPERGKVREDDSESARAKGGDVFDDDPRRPDFVDDSPKLFPKARSSAPDNTGTFSGDGDVLAGEPAANEVDAFHTVVAGVFSWWRDVDVSHVAVSSDVGPMLREDFLRVRVVFNLPHHFHPGPLEAELNASDSREKGADSEHAHNSFANRTRVLSRWKSPIPIASITL
jgi:hypothetical protein